jgi:hypothetical protein
VPAPKQPKNRAATVRRLLLIEREGPKEIKPAQVPPVIEPPGQYPNNFMGLAVHPDGPADDIASTAETLLPATLTKNDNVVVSSYIFSREKIAA